MHRRAVIATALVLLLTACGSGEDPPGAGSDAAAESTPAARAAVPAPAEECALPERFPPETPLPPGCVSVSRPSEYGGITTVSVPTTASQETLVAFFDDTLPRAGFEITARDDREDGGLSISVRGYQARIYVEITPRGADAATGMRIQYVLLSS